MNDHDDFVADIAYLNSLADYMFLPGVRLRVGLPRWSELTVEEQVLDDTPFETRREIFSLVMYPPTFANVWSDA